MTYTFLHNISMTARWQINSYNVKITSADTTRGTVNDYNDSKTYGSTVNLQATTNIGYTFIGWYDGTTKISDELNYSTTVPAYNVTYAAKCSKVTLDRNNTSAGTVGGLTSTYKVGDSATITANTNNGYTWVGWYDGDTKLTDVLSYTFTMTAENKTYTANWQANTYTITFDVNGGNTLSSNIQLVTYDSSYALPTPTRGGYLFGGWYNEETKYIKGTWKTTSNLTLTAKWLTYEEYHNYEYDSSANLISFTYGEYPQTIKSSSVTIDESCQDSRGYYLGSDGEYYAKVTAKPYNSGYTYSNGATITSGYVYYFKVEPIKWKVLYNTDGTYLVMSDLILDTQCYYNSTSSRSGATDYQKNSTSSTVYANNYKYSDIRTFLNTTFINKAFTSEEQNLIQTTMVDNSVSSTRESSNQYVCEDTQDKIFLLSYKEVTNSSYGFSSDLDRYAKGTDYAKARGLGTNNQPDKDFFGCSTWWTRSPNGKSSYGAIHVYFDGDVNYAYGYVVGNLEYGVRPALNINL